MLLYLFASQNLLLNSSRLKLGVFLQVNDIIVNSIFLLFSIIVVIINKKKTLHIGIIILIFLFADYLYDNYILL
jgi:NADH:ubiquinone oxidoreductase subunit K